MYYIISGVIGAVVAVAVAALARSQFYVLAGLAPLFPSFALFAHIVTYRNKDVDAVRDVALFGAFSTLPYIVYVLVVYLALSKMRFELAVASGLFFWCVGAAVLVYFWHRA